MPDDPDVTQLLRLAASGERRDLDRLVDAVYDDLRRLALKHLQAERADHTLQPTAVVHEAYLRLVDQRSTAWSDRLHFFAVSSRIIRRVLVDHARGRGAAKRGGGRRRVALDPDAHAGGGPEVDLLALDEALAALAKLDDRQSRIVELRFFGGLAVPEIAELLGVGARTVDRDWQCARAWLFDRLGAEERDDGAPDGRIDGGGDGA